MVKNKLVFCEVLFILFFIISNKYMITNATENTNPQYFCPDLTPQKSLSLDQLMGMWYGVEVIQHRSDKGYTGIHIVEACPVLHFSRHTPSELRLLWSERAGTVEYLFQIPNPNNPGFWMSFGPQNGSMVHKTYRQFAGTAQVMKAVANHVVLTFCSPNTELYSVILSRTKWLDKMEVRGVRNMLQRRSLQQFGIRETDCNNSNTIHLNSKHLFVQFIVLIVFLNKLFNPL